jgi:hypothetical protein
MRTAKLGLFATLLVGIGAVMLVDEIGIGRYPPAATLADRRLLRFNPTDVRSCMGACALAAIGDRTSQRRWHHCAQTLTQTPGTGRVRPPRLEPVVRRRLHAGVCSGLCCSAAL